ncbi:MAG: CoA-binding protein [Bacteriovoracaceae bacterium]|nr:CoA-binding protein [Bacteroidota bacterium]
MLTTDQEIKKLLIDAKTIAVVGASPKPWRDSGAIAEFLKNKGYKVYPVNPQYQEVLGMKCYPDLKSVPEKIDIVDIFRNPDEVEPVIDEAITVGANAVWMQLNVVNETAAGKAEKAGLAVVMDRCIAVEYRALIH